MSSDPSTLLQATTVMCMVSALAYWCGVRALGFSRDAGRDWALANLLFGLGASITVMRSVWPSTWAHAAADSLELLAYACLQAGFERFLGRRWPLREHAWLLGAAAVTIYGAYAIQWPITRLACYCFTAAWLLGRAASTAFRGLRAEFGFAPALLVAAPIVVGSLLEFARGVAGIHFPSAQLLDAQQPTIFNVTLVWTGFVAVLTLNFAVAGFIGARQLARIRALTLLDSMTGALNRRALEGLLAREIAHRRRHGLPLSLIYFDLDHFKALNDRLGHAAGDTALRHAVQVVSDTCREGDVVARAGGEEFCVVLPYTGLEGACLLAERMRSALESSVLRWGSEELVLTASFGVASAGSESEGVAELLQSGDRAMYAAKANGRNCVSDAPRFEAARADGAAATELAS